MTKSFKICNECKPSFYAPNTSNLIKATQPMERLNLDFNPSVSKNKYILIIVDEYSSFPFAIPCSDIKASTLNKSLCHVFSPFGVPNYIHSDRGSNFMSQELKGYE